MNWTIHYFFHFGMPLLLAYGVYRKKWKQAYGVMLLTMLVDLDHLLATPIYDPSRCSIGFHPLHSYWAIGIYIILLFFEPPIIRWIAVGLVWHMITDAIDCYLM